MYLRAGAPDRSAAKGGAGIDSLRSRFGLSFVTLFVGVLAGALPFLDIAVMNPLAGVALETCAGLVALLGAYLFLGRFLRSGRRTDLALLACLSILAGSNVLMGALPAIASSGVEDALTNWAGTGAVMVGACAMVFAAWLPDSTERHARRAAEHALGSVAAFLTLLAALAIAFRESIPPSITNDELGGHPIVLAMQMFCATFFAVAAMGFLRRADRDNDTFMRWVEAAAILGAFARLNYLLYPVTDPHWIHAGDVLRLGFYLLLTIGAAREIADYWGQLARSALLEERRRLARDMHDGLAQELAYIARQTHSLDHSVGPSTLVERIHASTERALLETRRAISALTDTSSEPLEVALVSEAQDVAERSGVALRLDLAQEVNVSLAIRDALLRIVREALTNAVDHGRARNVALELRRRGKEVVLRISDDGRGFDPSVAPAGFGLISMRERVEALGGDLRLRSEGGRGTEIKVTIR